MHYTLYIIILTIKTLYFAEWGKNSGILNIHSVGEPTRAFLLQNVAPNPSLDEMYIMERNYSLNRLFM